MSESAHHAPAPQTANVLASQPIPVYQVVDISKVKRQGETWLLNSQLTYPGDQGFFEVHFISNGQSYNTISHFIKDGKSCLYYDLYKVNNGSPFWTDDNYRVISFTHKLDTKLLTWLTANGIKI